MGADRASELENRLVQVLADGAEGGAETVREPVAGKVLHPAVGVGETDGVLRMERGVEALHVGGAQVRKHPADDEVAADRELVGALELLHRAGLLGRADEPDDGPVDRHPAGAAGKAAQVVRGQLPGGLDEVGQEAGGERLAVQGDEHRPALGE